MISPVQKKQTEYTIRLSQTDRYRHSHLRVKDKVVFFRVQIETFWQNEWYPIVRYDNAHGFAHRDLMNRKGDAVKTPLFNQDLNDALTFAENDLKTNWRYYKERFLEEP